MASGKAYSESEMGYLSRLCHRGTSLQIATIHMHGKWHLTLIYSDAYALSSPMTLISYSKKPDSHRYGQQMTKISVPRGAVAVAVEERHLLPRGLILELVQHQHAPGVAQEGRPGVPL